MEPGIFDRPVRVVLGRGSTPKQVSSVVEAADILLSKWPLGARSRRKHAAALDRCHAALERQRSRRALREAREAFEAAADEARILVAEPRTKPASRRGSGLWRKLKRYI